MEGRPDQAADAAPPPGNGTDELFSLAYAELRGLARTYAGSPTLQPTALVHEAYGRIAGADRRWNDREHFLAVAARAMRQVLVDHLRARGAAKRPDPRRRVTLLGDLHGQGGQDLDFLELHVALERLERIRPRYVRLVELRFFAGLTEEEAGRALDVSVRTVKREWRAARAWLATELS